jgi:tetratricopeptide (TPR) repeat protein
VLSSGGQFDQAAIHCGKVPANYWAKSECIGEARLAQGRIDEAIQILETAFHQGVTPGSAVRGYLGNAYAQAGRRDDAEKFAASTPSINPFNRALIFAGLGDKDRAFEALNEAAAAGPFRIGRALTFPEFALLRGATPRRSAGEIPS